MGSHGQVGDWAPFALFIIAMFASGMGTLLAAVNKLWTVSTLFAAVFAASVAATLIYSM